MKILYVNAIVCPITGEIFKRGVERAVQNSNLAKSGDRVEIQTVNLFYKEKAAPRSIGNFFRDSNADAVILSGSEKNITDREDRWVLNYIEGL